MLDFNKINKISKNTWFFRFKKFDKNSYLITNDIWKYSFLTKKEFNDFLLWKMDSWDKYNQLLEDGFIKNENYDKNMIKKYSKKNDFLYYWPSLHIIVTTLRCNHKCKYCHAAVAPMTAKNMDMTKETAQKVVDAIFYTSNLDITIEFQWWEALVNWDVVKYIIEYSEVKWLHLQKNVNFALVTNLTLMDDEKFEFLTEHNVHITTSLDWDEETHNYNRTFEEGNSYEDVVYWIKKIHEYYQEKNIKSSNWWKTFKKVWALLTVTKKSLNRYKEIIDSYIEVWINNIYLRWLNPYWFASKMELNAIWYSTEEFIEFYKNSMDYIIEINKKRDENWELFREWIASMYLTKILTDIDPNYLDARSPCWAWIWQVAYNYDGKIYTCDEWRMLWRMWDDSFFICELQEDWKKTYNKIINSATTKTILQASTLDWLPWYNESVYKPYLWVCPIHSYKMSWNIIPNYSVDEKRKIDEFILDYLFDKLRDPSIKKMFSRWVWIS